MAGAVKTAVTELAQSRVRVDAEVAPEEVERRVQQKARDLGRDLRVPGFRKGKVPAPLVIARVGRDAVLDEAIRDTLGRWYADAIDAAGIVPVGDPQLDLGEPPAAGEPLTFSIEIAVRPAATLGDYRGLEVPRREPSVTDADVDSQLEGLRERLARLETVDEPALDGDFVVLDYEGTLDGSPIEGGEGRDQLVELGAGRLVGGLEQQLVGARAGEERTAEIVFPADYQAPELAGRPASFHMTVKEVKRKQLPEVDEDFAADAGFDSVAEMRQDVAGRLREAQAALDEEEFREAAVDVAAARATIDVPSELVAARAREMWERALHSLSHRGVSKETYLRVSGRSEDEILAEALPEAERSLRREAVIAAIVQAERIAPTDEDLLESLAPLGEREGVAPEKLFTDLRRSGRLEDLREEVASRQAVDLVAASAVPIPAERAAARERLWIPGGGGARERPGGAGERPGGAGERPGGGAPAPAGPGAAPGRLWTPGERT